MKKTEIKLLQESLFEEDYLLRTLGPIARIPDIALTELVANAWDSGASKVEIHIPEQSGEEIFVSDDGSGMTADQFIKRWMTLGYNRVKHQGLSAEFPPGRSEWWRPAYGRNGVGRHGLLCFADSYLVETHRDGFCNHFSIETTSGKNPFIMRSHRTSETNLHGTRLHATVQRHLPSADRIRQVLSARFLHDPRFTVYVNGKNVPLSEHTGLVDKRTLQVTDHVKAEAFFIDSTRAARTTEYQGIAFWVGGRLVGEPSWQVGLKILLDGRTRTAKRHTAVVRSDDLFDEVEPDWTGFRKSEIVDELFEKVTAYVEEMLLRVSKERIQETKESAIAQNVAAYEELRPLGKLEVSEFIEKLVEQQPLISSEIAATAVQTIINLEKSRSGAALLKKLSKLNEEDVEALDRLLGEWTVRDAMTVLDELDCRINVIEAIARLCSDPDADELHTLHPLVTQAKWLFGPEFDSPEFTSNKSLTAAMRQLFDKAVKNDEFLNPRKRPDLLVLEDATVSGVATEHFEEGIGLVGLRDILLIELKKGQATINRENVNQAVNYVEDLLNSGHLDGKPYVKAFVVGHKRSEKVEPVRRIGDQPEKARIQVTTFGQLVRTAEKRLFGLRERLENRYEELTGETLYNRLTHQSVQLPLLHVDQEPRTGTTADA
jgi:Histidine kinase-, DNA gyrase B-, and HSP90-like ATPase